MEVLQINKTKSKSDIVQSTIALVQMNKIDFKNDNTNHQKELSTNLSLI
jgi:hypothetical protein